MAGPVAGFIQLPVDTGNLGKKVRTQSRVVGADTVHEHFMVPISIRKITGNYYAPSVAIQSVQASAQNGTSSGFFWLEMPTGGTTRGRIRKIEINFNVGSAAAADHFTLPRLALTRFTFTGAFSGALITPCKRHASDSANVANVRTIVTGGTVTVGGVAWITFPPAIDFTAAAGIITVPPSIQELDPVDEDDYLDFGAGEGFLLYQPDAGTASDSRRFHWNIHWDEYDFA